MAQRKSGKRNRFASGGLIGTLFSKYTYSIGSAAVAQRRRWPQTWLGEGKPGSANGSQTDGSTLSFSTLRTSIGRPMRRLNQVCKESALKPSNPSVVATGRLPPATPCGPGVLTVCCRSPHAGGGQSCGNPYSKTTISTLNGGPTAPLSGCCCRTQRKRCGPHLLHLQQCGAVQLTGEYL